MTDAELEAEERRILQGAQRAFSPSNRDAERVLACTLGALAAAPAAEPGQAAHPGAPAVATKTSAVGFATAGKLLGVLVIAAGSGLIGYAAGYRDGTVQDAKPRSTQTAVPAGAKAAGSGLVSDSDSVSGSDSDSVSDSVSASDSDSDPVSDSDSDSVSGSDSARRLKPAHALTTLAPTPTTVDPHSLQLELRALRNVERALRDQQPQRALELLGELDRDVPEGALVEERLAAFQMARCARGLGTPSRLRAEFSDAYPGSVYRARVEQTCRDRGPQDAK